MKAKIKSAAAVTSLSRKRVSGSSPKRAPNKYLFAYGTLKRGGKFHRQLSKIPGIQFIGEARMSGELYQLPKDDFPGAIMTSLPNKFVHGDLFLMRDSQKTLRAMDALEEVDKGLFRRKLVDVWLDRSRVKAWAYFYLGSVNPANLLATGVYSSK